MCVDDDDDDDNDDDDDAPGCLLGLAEDTSAVERGFADYL